MVLIRNGEIIPTCSSSNSHQPCSCSCCVPRVPSATGGSEADASASAAAGEPTATVMNDSAPSSSSSSSSLSSLRTFIPGFHFGLRQKPPPSQAPTERGPSSYFDYAPSQFPYSYPPPPQHSSYDYPSSAYSYYPSYPYYQPVPQMPYPAPPPSSSSPASPHSLFGSRVAAPAGPSPMAPPASGPLPPTALLPPNAPAINPAFPSSNPRVHRNPNNYNLFGLPDIMVYEITIKPHVYLMAALMIYLIGPQALIALVVTFHFYRWHLNKQQEIIRHQAYLLKKDPALAPNGGPPPPSGVYYRQNGRLPSGDLPSPVLRPSAPPTALPRRESQAHSNIHSIADFQPTPE